MVSVEISCCAAKFGRKRDGFQQVHLIFEPFCKYGNLLAQAGGGGRLPVCACQHRDVFPFIRPGKDLFVDLFQLWK